jgi:hypothetical protein
MTGAHARMLKDLGMVEFLRTQGIIVKKPAPTK